MQFSRFLTFFLLLPTVLLTACQKEDLPGCLRSTGRIETQTRPLPNFRTLRIYDNLEVVIYADTVSYVRVTAGENLQKYILTEVKNGELSVRNSNKCNWVRSYDNPLRVEVHVPKLKDIFHDGDATLSSPELLPADTLFLHLTGAGDADLNLKTESVWLDMYELAEVRLRGTNGSLKAYVLSVGSLKAEAFQNQEAYVQITNQGQAFLQATQTLTAEINGPGNVYYQSEPAQKQTFGNGPGQLLKIK